MIGNTLLVTGWVASVMLVMSVAVRAAEPAVGATTGPTVTPEVRQLLDQVRDAYGALKSLDVAGTLSMRSDVGGQTRKMGGDFTGSYEAPNLFRHEFKEARGGLTLGATGKKFYVFLPGENRYLQDDLPAARLTGADWPGEFRSALQDQNYSLVLAMSKDASAELLENVTTISRVADSKLGDLACPTLLVVTADQTRITLRFDPGTHLLRQMETDLKSRAEQTGAADVKELLVVEDFTTVKPNAAVKDEQFAWAPPAGAREMSQEGTGEAKALEGKPAPSFKLNNLKDQPVALSSFKGQVVIVDFWATWCGPCRVSLPHLNALSQAYAGKGVTVLSIDLKEEKEEVAAFVESNKFTFTVLLDPEAKVGELYKAEGIPETVVIGKDGKVKKVFIGYSDAVGRELKKIVEAELAK